MSFRDRIQSHRLFPGLSLLIGAAACDLQPVPIPYASDPDAGAPDAGEVLDAADASEPIDASDAGGPLDAGEVLDAADASEPIDASDAGGPLDAGDAGQPTCNANFADCDQDPSNGCEVDLTSNAQNCKFCGNTCGPNEACVGSFCACSGTMPMFCGGSCRDLATDVEHCGACHASASDGNPCTDDICVGGGPSHANSPAGTSCAPDGVCDGEGICVGMGTACATGTDCSSGFCADGVCCNAACDEPCMKCDIVGNVGTCIPVPLNVDDHVATSPCEKSSTCNGNGVCKSELGVTCTANVECSTGHCENGVCSAPLDLTGSIAWQMLHECCVPQPTFYSCPAGFTIHSLVSRADGSVMAAGFYGSYGDGIPNGNGHCGFPMGYNYDSFTTKEYATGPHPFQLNVDENATLTSLEALDFIHHTTYKGGPMCGWCSGNATVAYGPALWEVGGGVGYYYKSEHHQWDESSESKGCFSAGFMTPSWALSMPTACGLDPWQAAGNDAGNVVLRNASGLTMFDPSGQTILKGPDPFSSYVMPPFAQKSAIWSFVPSKQNALVLSSLGEVHAGARNGDSVWLAKANASGILQWSKMIAAPTTSASTDFSFGVDASGNILVAFSSTSTVDLGNGPVPKLGAVDLILAKLDPQGNVLWTKRFGGPGFEVHWIELRRTGSADFAILLDFAGQVDLGDGVLPASPNHSGVVAKFDASGTIIWRAKNDRASALTGHPSGAVYVGGPALTVTKYNP